MATSGSFNTTSRQGRYLTFSWSLTSQSVENNTSTISWTVTGAGSSGYVMCGPVTTTVNGSPTTYSGRTEVWNGTTIHSGTAIISHNNSTGAGSFSASISAAIYTYAVNDSGSGSWNLPTIARASTATLSSYDITLGDSSSVTVSITRQSDSFTHEVWYNLRPEKSEPYYGYGESGSYWSGVATSQLIQLPTSLARYCPKDTEMICDVIVRTKSGNTTIGSDQTLSCTLRVPSYTPSCEITSCTPISSNTTIHGWGIYAKGYSYARVAFRSDPLSLYSAQIIQFNISGDYTGTVSASLDNSYYIGSCDTSIFNTSGQKTIKVTAVDSRGKTSPVATYPFNVEDYYKPSITLSSAERCDSSGDLVSDGQYAKCSYQGSLSSLAGNNSLTYAIAYKLTTASSWTTMTSGTDYRAIESNSSSIRLGRGSTFDNTSEYEIRFTVTDGLSNSSAAVVKLNSAERVLNIAKYGNGFAVGKMSSVTTKGAAGKFEVGWAADFDNTVNVDGALQVNNTVNTTGAITTTAVTASGTITAGNGNLVLGSAATGERSISFPYNGHNTYIYGRSNSNDNVPIGIYDGQNSMSVFYYNDSLRQVGILGSPIADFVVEESTATPSGYNITWTYRKWKSGKVECWGTTTITPTNTAGETVIALPFEFSSTDYCINVTPLVNGLILDSLWVGDQAGNEARSAWSFKIGHIKKSSYGDYSVTCSIHIMSK